MPGEDFIQSQTYATSQCEIALEATQTTVNGAANSATQTLADTTGLNDGDKIYFYTTGAERTILTVNSSTSVTLTATINTTNGETVRKRLYVNDIGNIGTIRIRSLVSSTSAPLIIVPPSDQTTVYGRSWFIYADEAVQPIIITIDGGAAINGNSDVTLSTNSYDCIILHARSDGGWIAWELNAAA